MTKLNLILLKNKGISKQKFLILKKYLELQDERQEFNFYEAVHFAGAAVGVWILQFFGSDNQKRKFCDFVVSFSKKNQINIKNVDFYIERKQLCPLYRHIYLHNYNEGELASYRFLIDLLKSDESND